MTVPFLMFTFLTKINMDIFCYYFKELEALPVHSPTFMFFAWKKYQYSFLMIFDVNPCLGNEISSIESFVGLFSAVVSMTKV